MNNKYIQIYLILVVALLLVLFFYWQNNDLVTTDISYINNKVPESFDGYNIIHISDLHNKRFGNKQSKILSKIAKENPDIILITGDIIDRRRYNLNKALEFVEGVVRIAPVYYVAGNHEAWSFKYAEVDQALSLAGVNVLNNKKLEIVKNNSKIEIIGLKDAAFDTKEYAKEINLTQFKKNLNKFSNPSNFSILLSHRPEIFDLYVESNIDLIFSGHAHGGQFRLPLLGGLYSPNQGIFPTYTSGVYSQDKTSMIVSRGLGNSLMPIRLFNKPEIIKVTLKSRFKQ